MKPRGTERKYSWRRRPDHYTARRRQTRGYPNGFHYVPSSAAIGFKPMQSQARQYPVVWEHLREREVKLIRAVRHNQLKILVSRMMVKRIENPHSTTRQLPSRLHLPTWNLKRRLNAIARQNERWSTLLADVEFLPAVYERVLSDRQTEFRRILEFPGVDSDVALRNPCQKLTPDRLQEVIENYTDVVHCLSGTRFET